MAQKRKDRELHWRRVLQRQAESDLNVASFCRQESISAASFYAWRQKLKARDAQATEASSRRDDESAKFAAQLLPVRIDSGSASESVRIFLPRGLSIEASSSIDRSALVELASALCEAHGC